MKKRNPFLLLGILGAFLFSCTNNLNPSSSWTPFSNSSDSSENSIADYYSSFSRFPNDYELYYWRENTSWKVGAIVTTNRIKTAAEIDALPGLSLPKMKEVIEKKAPLLDYLSAPFVVSRPSTQSQIDDPRAFDRLHPQVSAYLYGQMGRDEKGLPTSSTSEDRHALTVDKASTAYLAKPLLSHYQSGSWIEVDATVLADANLEIQVNGEPISTAGFSFPNEQVWCYYFKMPAKDATLSFSAYHVKTLPFEEAYPWAKNLTESAISNIVCTISEADLGPGGMDSHYHGDSSADKQAFLSFVQDNILQENKYRIEIAGGIPTSYGVTISGNTYTFSYNSGFLDNLYSTNKHPSLPSTFDDQNFISFGGGIYLYDEDRLYGREIADSLFLEEIHFVPYIPADAPLLSGYFFAYGQGIYLIDSKHFKYGAKYYQIITEQDFASYVHG